MKTLIFKDSSEESHLNQQLNAGLEIVNEILDQYKKTNLKPISDKSTLQAFFSDSVKFVSDQVQQSANLSGWKINPAKLVDLLQEPEVTTLLQMVKSRGNQLVHYGLNFGKFNKKGMLEADREAWAIYIDKQTCRYCETKKQEKVFHTFQKLIDTLHEINTFGEPLYNLVNKPLDVYLKSTGEGQPLTIVMHGFDKLSRE